MQRISVPYIYRLAEDIEPLLRLEAGPVGPVFVDLLKGFFGVRGFVLESVFSGSLRTCYQPAVDVLGVLDKWSTEKDIQNKELTQFEVYDIKKKIENFKNILLAELEHVPVFLVKKTSGYDTLTLLDSGIDLFPLEIKKIPSAKFDIEQATRALAFDMGTACAFHVFRAVETVLRVYCSSLSENNGMPKEKHIGALTKYLEEKRRGNEHVLSALKQIKDLHRNPMIHPEINVSSEEAVTIIGMARSVISIMLKSIPEQEQA